MINCECGSIPLYKGGNKLDLNNYRPTSPLNKVTEKLLFDRLMSFFMKHNFFYERQYAYLSKTGTNVALMELVDEICKRVDSQEIVTGVFWISLKRSTQYHTIY